jgi:hypothetical protein
MDNYKFEYLKPPPQGWAEKPRPGPKVDLKLVRRAKELRAEEKTYKQIGDSLGVSDETVRLWCLRRD